MESFLRQILRDLRFDTYEWKQTKIWMIFNLKRGVLILVNGSMFLENGNMFLVNGKPFLDKSQISCGFLKYA